LILYGNMRLTIEYEDGIGEYYNAMGNMKYQWTLSVEAIPYYEKAVEVFLKQNNLARVSKMYSNMGNSFSDIGNIARSVEYHKKAIGLSGRVKDKKGLSAAYMNIGSVYINSGEYQLGAEAVLNALKIKEELGDKKGIANACNNLSVVFKEQKNYPQSIKYGTRALEIWKEMGDELNCGFVYNNFGLVYARLKDYKKAKENYKKGREIFEKKNFKRGIAAINDNLGIVLKNEGNYAEAIGCFEKLVVFAKENNDVRAMISAHINLGDTYLLQHKMELSFENFTKAAELSRKADFRNETVQIYLGLSDYYKEKKDYIKALEYRTKYEELNDSLLNEGITQQIADVEKKYDTEKKELQIKDLEQGKLISQLELEKRQQDINRQRIIIGVSVVVILLAVALVFFIFRSYKEKEKSNKKLQVAYTEIEEKNHLVEEKNKEILDSIFYAKRIQTALLASDKLLSANLPEYFVLYKPKDIVSGDFYWAQPVNNNFLICAADCTGHGVPGAFMSLLGVSYLNEIVRDRSVNSPAEVLNKLRTEIIYSLNSANEDEYGVNDGMDIALCNYKFDSMKLQFACANNPLWLMRDNKIHEYKADKFPVGKYHGDMQSFTNNEIDLQKGDVIYILTDGYPDQFGGPNGKKFKYKPLQELLLSIALKPMAEQKQILDDRMAAWKGDLEQIDDILIIGIRV
jgi:serine phosphatase RsbU (regulator of sigma subunit)/Tfp pilus assembly protein PilF